MSKRYSREARMRFRSRPGAKNSEFRTGQKVTILSVRPAGHYVVEFDDGTQWTVEHDELTSIKEWWVSRVALGLMMLFVATVIVVIIIGLFI